MNKMKDKGEGAKSCLSPILATLSPTLAFEGNTIDLNSYNT